MSAVGRQVLPGGGWRVLVVGWALAALVAVGVPRMWRPMQAWGMETGLGRSAAALAGPRMPLPTGLGALQSPAGLSRPFGWTERAGRPWFAADVRIAVPRQRTVWALSAGRVAAIGDDPLRFGLYVAVVHPVAWVTLYGDCGEVRVRVGQEVTRGAALCQTGDSGPSGPGHLILAMFLNGAPVNPAPYLAFPGGRARLAAQEAARAS